MSKNQPFDNTSTKNDSANIKLPPHIKMMVEKGNIVSAIKNFSSEANISMDEAKDLIDEHEKQLLAEIQAKQDKILKKQAKKQNGGFLKNILASFTKKNKD